MNKVDITHDIFWIIVWQKYNTSYYIMFVNYNILFVLINNIQIIIKHNIWLSKSIEINVEYYVEFLYRWNIRQIIIKLLLTVIYNEFWVV